MKKLLLSSLMMFAVCGYVNAQNATGSKLVKPGTTTTSAAPTPQKAAITNDVSAKPASDNAAQTVAPAPGDKAAKLRAEKATQAVVGADGVPTSNNDLAPKDKEELKKMEAAKAANAKKNN